MKFKCIVEYEYPVKHKPPVKADIYLHGDKVVTSEIKSLQNEFNHEAFYKFLFDAIQPNEMEKYMSMFLSGNEKVKGE